MGLFNFLAAGNNSLRGLVRRSQHQIVEDDGAIPNFAVRPQVAERMREVRRERRRDDPFAAYQLDVQEREARAHQKAARGPKVRSTFRPEQLRPIAKPQLDPPALSPEEPRQVPSGSVWNQKLKMSRRGRTTARVKRQPKRPAVYRKAGSVIRRRRSPNWMA
jgi:hypothetical protein